jgi:ATP-binding cassette subfamily F protein 3
MLQIEDLTKEYHGEVLLDHISCKLNKGERWGLVGRNGSGKTTLLRLIIGQETPDGGAVHIPKSYLIGYLDQHLHFTQETLLDEAALGLRPHERDHLYKVEKILFGLGFKEEDLYRHPSEFSGGYQLRIQLTKVIVGDPDCLLLDEPTNYLDIVSIRWFVRFLREWKGEMILISHDRDFMDSVTTHTVGIHRKGIRKYEGGTEKFYSQLLQDEEIHERTRVKQEKKRENLESFITRFGAKASKATQAQSKAKALARMPTLEKLAALHNLDFSFPYTTFPGQKMVGADDLSFTYDPEAPEPLIQHFSIEIGKQDRIAVIGKNGRGKSTLLKLLAKELQPQSGTIKISENVKIGYFGQTNIDRLCPTMTIEEEIGSARPNINITEVRRICGVMMFSDDKAKKPISVLSGGERSRVLLGKLLATPCNLLLVDEPTNHLDMESIEALITALDEFEGSVVIVTHSEMILRQLPTKFVICRQGNQKLFLGDYDEFLEKEGWEPIEKPAKAKIKNKTDDKKKQAEQLQQRSKALQPLEKQMKEIEQEIIRFERMIELETEELVKMSEKGDHVAIAAISKNIDDKKKQIDEFFVELNQLSVVYEERKASFS